MMMMMAMTRDAPVQMCDLTIPNYYFEKGGGKEEGKKSAVTTFPDDVGRFPPSHALCLCISTGDLVSQMRKKKRRGKIKGINAFSLPHLRSQLNCFIGLFFFNYYSRRFGGTVQKLQV